MVDRRSNGGESLQLGAANADCTVGLRHAWLGGTIALIEEVTRARQNNTVLMLLFNFIADFITAVACVMITHKSAVLSFITTRGLHISAGWMMDEKQQRERQR